MKFVFIRHVGDHYYVVVASQNPKNLMDGKPVINHQTVASFDTMKEAKESANRMSTVSEFPIFPFLTM